ncbi:MAG: YifB family Mg chelatase-like AAA ATPase [Lentisphaeria bacterium]|nr:YifB family Mg chelatase-like AAA ATPase [Lentisphaeria bacterium]
MLAKTISASVIGIEAFEIEIEVNVQRGGATNNPILSNMGNIAIVGLPDLAVKESRERIKSAFVSSGFRGITDNITVNLAPADIRKEGAAFDLAIALAILGGSNQLKRDRLSSTAILGELALDGSVRAVKGVLPIAVKLAKTNRIDAMIVPFENREEAANAAPNLKIYPVKHLLDAVNFFNSNNLEAFKSSFNPMQALNSISPIDFADVKGQVLAKRALEIAAAGGHNSLMIGPPGTGKSMLASRVNTILPPMTFEESLEVSQIYSVLGLLNNKNLISERPFRAPHHTISDIALIGGGKDIRPGEITLAHHGVLFLDEFPEFKRNVLEVLRQPLENGVINIARASGSCTFPAEFMLVAAMNPCPCGRGEVELGCTCKIDEKRRYLKKISGPLLDRIDLHVELKQLSQDELLNAPNGESSAAIRARVMQARAIQLARLKSFGKFCNSQLNSRELQLFCKLNNSSMNLLRQAITQLKLSPRAYDRILKVARTIADLANSPDIKEAHIFEAISYRKSDIIS